MNKTLPSLLLSALILAGCGGGSGSDDKVIVELNFPPTVSVSEATVFENETVTLIATAADADGIITSISWQQTEGQTVTLTGEDSATVSFTAPDIDADTELKFTVTVTDELGKSSSATSTVTVKATDVSYRLEGVVTDAPISNAVITTEINGATYTATANANGEYTLEIKLATDAGDELIILTATSPSSSAVLFHAILGNAEDIRTAAGDDTTLSNAELFATNVTNVSSAYYALLALVNSGNVPATKTAMLQAALNMEGDLLLPFATAVKLVLDYAANNPDLALPTQFATVAEWLANRDAVLEYINLAKLNAQESYDAAMSAIKADEKLVEQQPATSTLVGRYYIDRTLGNRGVAQFTLNADQTGEWLERDVGGAFNWSLTNEGIVLDFGTPGLLIDNTPIAEFAYTETATYLQQVTLLVASATDVSTHFSSERVQMSAAGEAYNYEQLVKTSSESFKAFKQNVVANALDYIELNTEYALPYVGTPSTFVSDTYITSESFLNTAKLRLVADTNTSGIAYFDTADYAAPDSLQLQQGSYPWQLNNAGQIVIALSDTDYVEISAFSARASADNPYVSVKAKLGDIVRAISYPAIAQRAVAWSDENVPGIYQLPVDPLAPNVLFWLELNADGTALTVSTYDANSDGTLTPNEASLMPGYWQLDSNGDLHVRRYRKNSNGTGYCQAAQWQPLAADDCQLYNDRKVTLYNFGNQNAEGERDVSFIIDHRFYDSFLRGGDTGNVQLGYDFLAWGSYYNAIWRKIAARPIAID